MKSWWRKRSIDDDNEDDTTVIGTSTMAFPCLSSLEIANCPLTSMPLYPSLDDDLRLVKTSSRPLKQTMKMNITGTTPSSSTSSLPLSKLKAFHVHKIEGLDTHMLDEYLKHFTGLKKLTIGDCKEVDLEGMQWQALKNLSHLEIINIPQLVSLPLGLQHLVQLKRLEIRNCSGLRSLFPVFQHLTFLEVLVVMNCEELELSAAGFQIFQDHTRLRSLALENIPKCRHLPEWIQHLTNLQILSLVDWPNLTSLPDEMRRLTSWKKGVRRTLVPIGIRLLTFLQHEFNGRAKKQDMRSSLLTCPWHCTPMKSSSPCTCFGSLLRQRIAYITKSRGHTFNYDFFICQNIPTQENDSWSRVGESLNTQCGCQVKSWKDLASEYLVVRMRLMLYVWEWEFVTITDDDALCLALC
ncbi:hypothetical protein GOBAR_DD26047 [Gossypium barbadense]|nr:hypothetical protein GOBAR_DD26047 [Gossypium barbadense]